jgi:fructose-1,6-bisphosphatase/sedoheptulose 1,7-bisphosphatase-like protein
MIDISLDLIRVTEAAAIAASQWVGSGNKLEADKAATEALRNRLNKIDFHGIIAIGEGEKDESYGLFEGERVGKDRHCEFTPSTVRSGSFAPYDISLDPIEGTTPTVTSGPEAISTLAMSHFGTMYKTKHFYADKIAYGPSIKSHVNLSIDNTIEENIKLISKATGKNYNNIVVCVLNRPRHNELISRLRDMNVRIKLIQDCDITGAVASCLPNNDIDMLCGIGGSPEAVISAAAIKCLGGDFQIKAYDRDGDVWTPQGEILGIEDLVSGPCVFVATGITDGSMLKGVKWSSGSPVTNSVFMRSESGTVRWIKANHGN